MTDKGLGDCVARNIIRRVSGDGDIVIINNQFNVKLLGDSQTSGFSIISFLLRTIGTQTEKGFIGVSHGYAVDVRPHMTETTGAKFYAGGES